jgi:hypothetical protein
MGRISFQLRRKKLIHQINKNNPQEEEEETSEEEDIFREAEEEVFFNFCNSSILGVL